MQFSVHNIKLVQMRIIAMESQKMELRPFAEKECMAEGAVRGAGAKKEAGGLLEKIAGVIRWI